MIVTLQNRYVAGEIFTTGEHTHAHTPAHIHTNLHAYIQIQ